MTQLSMHSPVGDLTLSQDGGAIVAIDWGWAPMQSATPLLTEAKDQLNAYFDGALTAFDLPLRPAGTAFQRAVYDVMTSIPYGKTMTYAKVAQKVGSVARAVGGACGSNPIPIVIPCHRVVAAPGRTPSRTSSRRGAGALGGYSGAGGVDTKRALLRLEGADGPGRQLDLNLSMS